MTRKPLRNQKPLPFEPEYHPTFVEAHKLATEINGAATNQEPTLDHLGGKHARTKTQGTSLDMTDTENRP